MYVVIRMCHTLNRFPFLKLHPSAGFETGRICSVRISRTIAAEVMGRRMLLNCVDDGPKATGLYE